MLTKDIQLLGAREGVGKGVFPSGDSYEGEYVGGKRDGEGTYTYAAPPPGEDEEAKPPLGSYSGRWLQGAKDNLGTLTYSSGHKYQGTWKEGKYDGDGTMFYPNGDIYSGRWVNGAKHGLGTYIFKATTTKVTGEWADNVLMSGTFSDQYGNTYDGNFSGSSAGSFFTSGGQFTLASGAVEFVPEDTITIA